LQTRLLSSDTVTRDRVRTDIRDDLWLEEEEDRWSGASGRPAYTCPHPKAIIVP